MGQQQTTNNLAIVTPEMFLRDAYYNMVSGFCDLDDDVFLENIRSFADWKDYERVLYLDTAVFLSKYLSVFGICLVLNYGDSRNIFADAINKEMQIDSLSDEKRISVRQTMRDGLFMGDHFMEIGFSVFSQTVITALLEYLNETNDIFKSDELDSMVTAAYNDDVEKVLSIIFSNCSYLLRAFMCNGHFVKKVVKIVSSFEKKYANK